MVKLVDNDKPLFDPLPFDIAEDLMIYMRNDPIFYRRNFFPVSDHIRECSKNPKKINRAMIEKMVMRGFKEYCNKYKVQHKPEDIFTSDEKNSIIANIIRDELEDARK
jgi:hypothetical protein